MDTLHPTQRRPQLRRQLTVMGRVLVGTELFHGVTGLAAAPVAAPLPRRESPVPDGRRS